MAYAEAQKINAFWNDPGSIDQSDPVDKEKVIQGLDMIYHKTDNPTAVLELSFQSQIELEVFASVCDQALHTFNPSTDPLA